MARQNGHELGGIRLDSGNLAYLSREARQLLDVAGLSQVRIVATPKSLPVANPASRSTTRRKPKP